MPWQITTNGRYKEQGGGVFTVERDPESPDDFFLDMKHKEPPLGEKVEIVSDVSTLEPLAFRRNPEGPHGISRVRRRA